MDSGTIIFIAIIVLGCVIPIVLINSSKKKKEKLFLQALFNLAEKSNCKISAHDLWKGTGIGIDKEARKLFFIRKAANDEEAKEIDLSEIQKCRVVNTNRTVKYNESTQTVVDRLELAFSNKDKNIPEVIFEFYNSKYDNPTLHTELQLAGKWLEIVNSTNTQRR